MKKILLLSSVIFLSSCATTNISELGDKFLDLINPSDDATEVAMLSGEETLIAMDEAGGFTIDELEELSNDELIDNYPIESIRYYLITNTILGQDFKFDFENLTKI